MVKTKKLLAILLAVIMAVLTLAPIAGATPVPDNISLAREILGEGMVLLKNENNALPLKSTDTIAVFGQGQRYVNSTSQGYQIGGGGSGTTRPAYTPVGPIVALREAAKNGEINIYEPVSEKYDENIAYVPDAAMYDAAAVNANKAIMFISRFSSEGSDRSTGKGDWLLSDAETAMMKELSARFDDVIVIANVGGVIDTSWAVGEVEGIDIEALLMAWQGGSEGGNGIADVILGRVNPSGKLVDTYAKNINDYPSTEGFYTSAYVEYKEDIYVGYRYFETFNVPVNYEFGFGLSYTTFEFSDVTYRSDEDTIYVSAKITNTGSVAGKEVAQVYFAAPQMGTGDAKLSKAAKELIGFTKTGVIQPGASEVVNIQFPVKDMASFDDTGVTGHESAYVLEAGDYNVFIGNSVKDAGTRLAGTYTQAELEVTEQLSKLVAPVKLTERLLADGTYENMLAKGEIFNISADGKTKIEGEAFNSCADVVRTESFSNGDYTGTCVAYMNNKGAYVDYAINVEEAGLYDFCMNYANGRSTLTDIANFYVDDVKQPNVTINAPQTGDGTNNSEWYNFVDSDPTIIYLEKGFHFFKIATKGSSFANFDYFTLEPHEATTISANQQTYFEAEYFDDAGADTELPRREWFPSGSYQSRLLVNGEWQTGYEGGCLAYMNYVNNWVSYNIDVEEAGEYTLQFRMANGRAQVNDVATISVNGVDTGIKLTCPQTASEAPFQWYSFMDVDMMETVSLPAGRSVIKIQSKSSSFPNIDRIIITPKKTIAAAGTTRIEGENYISATGSAKVEKYNLYTQGISGACVAFLDVIGSSVTYNMKTEKSGEYGLKFCMANGYAAKNLTAELVINGDEDNVQKLTFNCPQTGTSESGNRWYNFIELEAGKIILPEGDFTLTLRADHTLFMSEGQTSGSTGAFANVEYMVFTGPDTPQTRQARMRSVASPMADDGEEYIIQLEDVVEGRYTMAEFLDQMTIEELASFATGYGAGIGEGTGSIGGSNAVNKKYGIPRGDTADGPGGYRISSKATSWGCEMLTACTWNTELAHEFGVAHGKEGILSKVDIWLAPGMNIHRNPMCGRNFEYYSEDPFLTGMMGAVVADGVQSQGVAVTIKHFIGNNKEGNRNSSDSRMSERAMREIYLEGFRIAVQGIDAGYGDKYADYTLGAWTIMSSYNFVNGIETSENRELLTGIVRNEWGFDGFIMTDWGNNSNIVKEVQAGNNVKMSSGDVSQLVTAYNNGEITRELLEDNAEDIIKILVKLPDYGFVPPPPTVSKVSSTAPTKIEAETYADSFDKVQVQYGEVINVGYMDQRDEEGNYASYVSYKLNVEKAGTYDLMFRAANNVSGTDILELSLDGVIYEDIVWDNASTGGWQVYVDREVGTIYLPAGEHTLKIKSKGSFGNLDYFVLTPNTIDVTAEITAPESAVKNEKFDVVIKTEAAPSSIVIRNEKGNKITTKITSMIEADASVITTVTLAVGTPGEARVLSVYDGEELLGTFTMVIENIPSAIVSVEAPEQVAANAEFEFTAKTTKDLYKGKLYNSNGSVIKSTLVSRAVEGDYATSVYSTKIGTASAEARTFTFKADYDKRNDFPFAQDIQILVNPAV